MLDESQKFSVKFKASQGSHTQRNSNIPPTHTHTYTQTSHTHTHTHKHTQLSSTSGQENSLKKFSGSYLSNSVVTLKLGQGYPNCYKQVQVISK